MNFTSLEMSFFMNPYFHFLKNLLQLKMVLIFFLTMCCLLMPPNLAKDSVQKGTPALTRSKRISSKPTHLLDYQCYAIDNQLQPSKLYPLSSVLGQHKLSPSFRALFPMFLSLSSHRVFTKLLRYLYGDKP